MDLPTRMFAILFITWLLMFSSCAARSGTTENSSSTATNTANKGNSANTNYDSVDELRALVNIPFEPEDLTWRMSDAGGGKRRLVAVMLLTPDAFRALTVKYSASASDVPVNVEQWFPAELTAMSETSGEMSINGKAYPATDHFQPPFVVGNAILIPDTNYVILDLQTN